MRGIVLSSVLIYATLTLSSPTLADEPARFYFSPNSTPSLTPSITYWVYDDQYRPFIGEIEEAVRKVLQYNWMLPSPLVIELGKPVRECPQGVIAYFCGDSGRGYSYINFMPASLRGSLTERYNTYYHELGHAVAEAAHILVSGDPCLEQNTYGEWQPWSCQWNEGFAEFFSAHFMSRSASVFPVKSQESPAYVANTMLQKVQEIGWDFFLCVYDRAIKAVYYGYWTRNEWESALWECSSPLLEVSLLAPAVIEQGASFELILNIHVLRPNRYIQAWIDIPDGFQILDGTPRFVWANATAGVFLQGSVTLKALTEGFFIFKASAIPVTNAGAQRALETHVQVQIVPSPTPRFSLLQATLSASEVRPGQEVFVSIQIQNTGKTAGTFSLRLRSNGELIVEESRFLIPGEIWDVEYALRFPRAGTYTITMDADPAPITIGQVQVAEPSPPPPPPPPSGGIVISIEATATRVMPNQEIIVRARITNNGITYVTTSVPFTVDGKAVMTSNLSIAPGRTEILEFKISFTADQAGTHTIAVGDSPPLTIYVEGPSVSKTPEQFFDSNGNGRLDDSEILTALDYWIKQRPVPDIGVLSDLQILSLLDKWIKGTRIAGQ
jgi:hypothetical protein